MLMEFVFCLFFITGEDWEELSASDLFQRGVCWWKRQPGESGKGQGDMGKVTH